MAYIPSLNDLPDESNTGGYVPSLADLQASTMQQNPAQQQTELHKLVTSAPFNAIMGAGDALRDVYTNVANLIPGVDIPHVQKGSGTGYGTGRVIGDTVGFLQGGQALNLGRAALGAQSIPGVSKVANALGGQGASGVARRILGGTAYGALMQPDSRGTGALEGAGLSAVGEALPLPFKLGAKIAEKFKPAAFAEKMMGDLSGGKTLEENSKGLAESIKSAFKTKQNEAKKLYAPVFDKLGSKSVYEKMSPPMRAYETVEQGIKQGYTRSLRKAHETFASNPTLENAHKLQSQLGAEIRDLNKGQLSIADRDILQGFGEAQSALKTDIQNFIRSENPKLANKYAKATEHYASEVAPYLENPKILKIAKGEVTNPKSLSGLFQNPEEDILKVVDDLGDDAKKKILYTQLGKMKSSLTPEKLEKGLKEAKEKGFGSYFTDDIENQMETLASRIGLRSKAQTFGGALAGSQGLPGVSEVAGGLIGAMAAPTAMKSLNPLASFGSSLAQILKQGYPAAKAAALASLLPQEPKPMDLYLNTGRRGY